MESTLRSSSFSRTSARFSIDPVAASRVRERDCSEIQAVMSTKPSDATAMPAQIRNRNDFRSWRRQNEARFRARPLSPVASEPPDLVSPCLPDASTGRMIGDNG